MVDLIAFSLVLLSPLDIFDCRWKPAGGAISSFGPGPEVVYVREYNLGWK